jgi:hypothetical protein
MPRWRRPADALEDFQKTIRAIVALVTEVPVRDPERFNPSPVLVRSITFSPDRPVPLRGPSRIALLVRLRYRLADDDDGWWTQIVAYQYALLDQRGQEILAYHWHPEGPSHVVTSHLHLGAGAAVGRAELPAAHLPTGLIPVTAVVRLAVEAFGVQPSRRQWAGVLQQAEAAFAES